MADFSPLIGKLGKARGLASGDAVEIVTGASIKVVDAGGLTVNSIALNATSATLASNGAALIGISGSDHLANAASATNVAEALDAMDAAISASSNPTLADAVANSDAANDLVMDLATAATDTTIKMRGAQTLAGTTAETLLRLEDSAQNALMTMGVTATADEVEMVMDNVLKVRTTGTDSILENTLGAHALWTKGDAKTGGSEANLFTIQDFDGANAITRLRRFGNEDHTWEVFGYDATNTNGTLLQMGAASATSTDNAYLAATKAGTGSGQLSLETYGGGDIHFASSSGNILFSNHSLTEVGTVTRDSADLTVSTTTSGNVVLNPSGFIDASSNLISNLSPGVSGTDAVNKDQLDAVSAGLDPKEAVRVATTAELTVTYDNGTAGVGATLTNAGTQAALAIDGVTLSAGDRVLVKDQDTLQEHNGIYEVTDVGSGSTNWVMTRATDFDGDPSNEINGGEYTYVAEGTANAQNKYVVFSPTSAATVGTTDIQWTIYAGPDAITASTGVTRSGNDIQLADAVASNGIAVSSGAISVQLEAAGAGTGGLAFDSNEIRVTAGDGIELTASGVAVDLATTSGLSFATGELQLDDSVAGTGISIASKVLSVDYGSSAGNAVEGNTTFAASAGAGLTGGQASVALGAGNISYTMTVGAGDGVTVNADDIAVNADSIVKVYATANDPTIAAKQLVAVNATDNVGLADASAATTANILGFASAAHDDVNDEQSVWGMPGQRITVDATYVDSEASLTANTEYFVSETAGNITKTAPVTSGAQVISVGFAISATQLEFRPAFRYEVA